jgi:hypothetical protein
MTARVNVLKQVICSSGCVMAVLLGAVALFASPSGAQAPASVNNGSQLSRGIPTSHRIDDSPMDGMGSPIFYEKRLKMLNAAQHQSMVADTDRLVKLVADLNAQINRSHASSLTPEQLRTVAEIEKLAHSVRDKMRMTVRSAAEYNGPTTPLFAPK